MYRHGWKKKRIGNSITSIPQLRIIAKADLCGPSSQGASRELSHSTGDSHTAWMQSLQIDPNLTYTGFSTVTTWIQKVLYSCISILLALTCRTHSVADKVTAAMWIYSRWSPLWGLIQHNKNHNNKNEQKGVKLNITQTRVCCVETVAFNPWAHYRPLRAGAPGTALYSLCHTQIQS